MNTPNNPLPLPPEHEGEDDEDRDDGLDKPEAPMQGEGNHAAARRHRASAERFVADGQVQAAADNAEPHDAQEADELKAAEAVGRSHAKR